MISTHTTRLVVALSIGAALGLIYGWVIDPIEYTDVTPDLLREDYRMDYILMVAEAHQFEFDPEAAARRLALLGSDPPAEMASSALDYATRNGFTPEELGALKNLLTAMQTYQPQGAESP